MKKIGIPAVSREVDFIARNVDEADDIWEDAIKVDPPMLKELSDAIYERADKDVDDLLNYLKDAIELGTNGLLRVNEWHLRSGSWTVWSPIYMAGGRKKRMGSAGVIVGSGKQGFRLIAWVYPRGGLHGRKELTNTCRKKFKEVHLASEDARRYPGWTGSDDAVVWFEEDLTLKTLREELHSRLAKQAKRFFRIAKPLLKNVTE